MTASQSAIETRLFSSFWDDGLLDLLGGIALLAIGIGWAIDQIILSILTPPMLVSLWVPLRRRLVEPRAGYVDFSRARQSKNRTGLTMTVLLGTGTFILAIALFAYTQMRGSGETVDWLPRFIPGLPAVLLAVLASITALLTEARRFHAYALLLLVTAAMTIALQLGPVLPMLVSSLAVLASGSILMTRFLRASALFEEEV